MVGVADALLGEATCACIVPVEGAIVTNQEMVEWCRGTLAEAKIPDLVRFLDAFPGPGREDPPDRALPSDPDGEPPA